MKIATRLKMALTGETFMIGTRATVEYVRVKLYADQTVDWTRYNVTVENVSTTTTNQYTLSANGECFFEIPFGQHYKVTLPAVTGYDQPAQKTYTAALGSNSIEHVYAAGGGQFEQLNVRVVINPIEEGYSGYEPIEGQWVQCLGSDGKSYGAAFINGLAVVQIPYGVQYTVVLPNMPGYKHDHIGDVHIAGIPSREKMVHYFFVDTGVFGIKEDGTRIFTTEIERLITIGALIPDDIIAVGFTDEDLENADRGDGTVGCGFCWKVTGFKLSNTTWAASNVEFDQTRLPFLNTDAKARPEMRGNYNTSLIIQIGAEKTPAVATPAATNCRAQTLTFGGVTKEGFLPAYGQLKRAAENQTLINYLYTALGKTGPNFTSGFWWTSCQYSATGAVGLNNGSFYNYSKTDNRQVCWCFDL